MNRKEKDQNNHMTSSHSLQHIPRQTAIDGVQDLSSTGKGEHEEVSGI